jgi:hypothetical protein
MPLGGICIPMMRRVTTQTNAAFTAGIIVWAFLSMWAWSSMGTYKMMDDNFVWPDIPTPTQTQNIKINEDSDQMARLCHQNQYKDSLNSTLAETATRVDSWLDSETEIERDIVSRFNANAYDHTRFEVFEEMTGCQTSCIGGSCREDKSKIACGIPSLKAPCVVYSIGSNNHWEFELDMLRRAPCEVHTFDCTGPISRFDVPSEPRLHFHHICIGAKNMPMPESPAGGGRPTVQGETWKLEKVQKFLNHSRIDLLKMDIEGFEWPMLNQWPELSEIRSSAAVLPFQILLEIHYRSHFREIASSRKHDFKNSTDMVRMQSHLLRMGYVTVINNPNKKCRHCVELTLVRIRCPKDPA